MLSNLNLWSYLYKDSPQNENVEGTKDDNENSVAQEIGKDAISNTEKAKEWGNYILGFGKTATNIAAKQVSNTAKQIRQNVSDIGIIEQSNIISKFSDEQTKFMEEKRLTEKRKREVCLPWFDALNKGEGETHILKTKILSISSDERNFLRNPPSGSGFEFNYDLHAPVAQLLLKEDSVLANMRFKLVPKKISEAVFWRNYFYRVFLIKQSLQGNNESTESIQQFSNCFGDNLTITNSSNPAVDVQDEPDSGVGDRNELSEENIRQLKSVTLKLKDGKENEEWEAELQKELSEFELVNEDNGQDLVSGEDRCDYEDLEREILNELEK